MQTNYPATLGFFPSNAYGGTAAFSLNSASNQATFGVVPDAGRTLTRFRIYVTVTGAPAATDITCTVYNDASGVAGATAISTTSTISSGSWATGWVEFTGLSAALTAGTMYWVVLKNVNATPASNYVAVRVGVGGSSSSIPGGGNGGYGDQTFKGSTNGGTSYGTPYYNSCGWRLGYADGTFAGTGIASMPGTVPAYNTTEAGTRFTVPSGASLVAAGIAANLGVTGSPSTTGYVFKLYTGSTPTLQATTNVVPTESAKLTGWFSSYFPSTVTVAPGTLVTITCAAATGGDSSGNCATQTEVDFDPDSNSTALQPLGGLSKAIYNGSTWTYTSNAGLPFLLLLDTTAPTSAGAAATTYAVDGPTSGYQSQALTYAVAPNGPFTGTITPSDGGAGGTFSPTSLTWSSSQAMQAFTYTNTSAGSVTLSFANSGSLTNPSNITLTVSAVNIASTAYSVNGPTAGYTNESLVYTVVPNGTNYTGTITPSDGGAGGTFTPTSLSWTASATAKTFTYQQATAGTVTISAANSGSLTNPSSISLSLTVVSGLTLAQVQGELNTRGLTAGFTAGTSGGVNVNHVGGVAASGPGSGSVTFPNTFAASLGAGSIDVTTLTSTLRSLLVRAYLVSTGTTSPVTADTWSTTGLYNGTPYYTGIATGLYAWTDGTSWYITSTAPGVTLPAAYFKTASSSTVVGPYTAQGSATGTPAVVAHGNAVRSGFDPDGPQAVNATQFAGQQITAAAPVTIPASIGTSTYSGGSVTLASTQSFNNTGQTTVLPANTTQFLGQAVVLDSNNYPGVNIVDVAGSAASTSSTVAANVTQIGGQAVTAAAPIAVAAYVGTAAASTAQTGDSFARIGANGAALTAITGATLAASQGFNNAGQTTPVPANATQFAGQAITASAPVTVPASIGTSTYAGGPVTLAASQSFNNAGQTTPVPANATQWGGATIATTVPLAASAYIAAPTAAQVATTVWADPLTGPDFGTGGSVGAYLRALSADLTSSAFASPGVFAPAALANAPTGGPAPTASAIATAVWTDPLASSDFGTAGSSGAALKASLGGSGAILAASQGFNNAGQTTPVPANATQFAGQAITASAPVTVPASIGTSTYAGGPVTLAASQSFNNAGQTTPVPANATQWGGATIATTVPLAASAYIAAPTAAQVATTVWADPLTGPDFGTGGSVGAYLRALSADLTSSAFASPGVFAPAALANAPTGGPAPTASAIATAVWTDPLASSDFGTAGSSGAALKASLGGSGAILAASQGFNNAGQTTPVPANATQFAGQAITASAPVTVPASIGTSTYAGGPVTLAASQSFNNAGQTTPVPANATQWGGATIATTVPLAASAYIAAPTAAQVATTVWADPLTGPDFGTGGSVGAYLRALSADLTSSAFASPGVFAPAALANAPTGGPAPTASAIATAVWTDPLASSDFGTAGSSGAALKASLGGSGAILAASQGFNNAGQTTPVPANATQFAGHSVVLDANNYPSVNVVDLAGSPAGAVNANLISVNGSAFSGPLVPANVEGWNGAVVAPSDTQGFPRVTIKSGTGSGEVNLSSGNLIGTVGGVTSTVAVGDKTGFSLSPAGLDAIAVTDPGAPAGHTTLSRMIVALWRRAYKKSTLNSSSLATYADDGVTVNSTQPVSDDGVTQTMGAGH